MYLETPLAGATCEACGGAELVWWAVDESHEALSLHVKCGDCGYTYPSASADKAEDTTRDALADIAREVVE